MQHVQGAKAREQMRINQALLLPSHSLLSLATTASKSKILRQVHANVCPSEVCPVQHYVPAVGHSAMGSHTMPIRSLSSPAICTCSVTQCHGLTHLSFFRIFYGL